MPARIIEEKEEKWREDPNISLGKAAIKNFCEASTIHGISSIFSAHNFVTRMFWIGMFVSVCSLLFWQIWYLSEKLNSTDIVVTSRKVSENELEFPVVILSNADPYSKAKLMQFPQRAHGTGKLEHLREILSNLSGLEAFELGSYLGYVCMFDGKPCWVERIAFPWIGNCLRFNSDINWMQKHPGPEYGLEMTLEVNESDYSNTFNNGQGIFVNIASTPFLTYSLQRKKGVVAAPGTLTKINMKKKRIIRLPHPYPDNCEKRADLLEMKGFYFKFPLGRFYSVAFCKFMSTFRQQMITCGVIDPEYKFIFDLYILTKKSNVSFNISGSKSEIENTRKCLKKVAAEMKVGDCKPPCIDEEFDFTISYLRWPSTEEAKEKLKLLKGSAMNGNRYENWTLDSIYKNILKIEVYFSDFDIEVVEQKAAYGLVEFASDMGGQVGLWIGASVYSTFEIVCLLASLTYYLFQSIFKRAV